MRALLLFVLLGGGCWDFDALRSGGGPAPDGPEDLASADLVCQGTALVEDCADGMDNDGDCKIDCADSECGASDLCKPVANLLGYGQFVLGAAPAVCPVGQALLGPPILYDAIDPNRRSCTGCSCGAPTACTTELRLYTKPACNSADLITAKVALSGMTTCSALSGMQTMAKSAVMDAPQPRCEPNDTMAKPEPAWPQAGHLCLPEMAQRDCTTPSCILQQLHNLRACVAVAGTECPAPFSEKRVWYQSYSDSRSCICSCSGAASGCEVAASLAPTADCSGMGKRTLPVGTCDNLPSAFTPLAVEYAGRPKAGATCNASGTAQGTATVADPVTVCCLPAR